MKINVQVLTKEGFPAVVELHIDGKLTLCTPTLLWCGKQQKQETLQQLANFLDQLETLGAEIERNQLPDLLGN